MTSADTTHPLPGSGPLCDPILVIDDDELSLELLQLQLVQAGYRVLTATSGEAALRLAAAQTGEAAPGTVLADLQMPGLSGRELAQALRTLLPRATLVAMSASSGDTSGYHAFTRKPLEVERLRETLAGLAAGPEPAPAPPEAPVLAEATYAKLRAMMPAAALAEVYEVCIRDTRQRAAQMLEAAEEGDRLRQLAHTVKGGAAMVGATEIASLAAFLESGQYSVVDVPEFVNKLLYGCDQLERILMTKVNPC